MKSNALSVIEQLRKDGKIFNNADDVANYYYCGVLWYWFNHLLLNGIIALKSKTMDMHILMACNLILERQHKNSIEDKLSLINEENGAKKLFEETTSHLNSKEYLYEKRGFYSNPKTLRLIKEIQNVSN